MGGGATPAVALFLDRVTNAKTQANEGDPPSNIPPEVTALLCGTPPAIRPSICAAPEGPYTATLQASIHRVHDQVCDHLVGLVWKDRSHVPPTCIANACRRHAYRCRLHTVTAPNDP